MFGLGGQDLTVVATGAATLAAISSETYSWTKPVVRPFVQNNGSGNLWVKLNAAGCSTINYDYKLIPDTHLVAPSGLIFNQITIYSDTELTFGTDFVVHGWKWDAPS